MILFFVVFVCAINGEIFLNTTLGSVVGNITDNIYTFYGVPYTEQAPINDNRFKRIL